MGSTALKLLTESSAADLSLVEDLNSKSALQISAEDIEEETGVSREELKKGYGLVRVILAYVVANQYTKSMDAIQSYLDLHCDYPDFADRVERYQKHCRELIAAIQVKRSMSSVAGLSNAKQHELREKVHQHFKELKANLDKIEHSLREVKAEDLRSTVWFVKAVCASFGVIFSILVLREIFNGELLSLFYVSRDFLETTVDLLFSVF
jgi:ElaB/YqjD/DUF883 family membrane-anchored ribosome-binding protein